DVALMPFAINESTRFISPTKTPEYLAGGRPVVSTPIRDVERHYGQLQAVELAEGPQAFVAACDRALRRVRGNDLAWRDEADAVLASQSWDQTQLRMSALIDSAAQRRAGMARPAGLAGPAVWPAMRRSHYDALVVGAGFGGSVLAERLASEGRRV